MAAIKQFQSLLKQSFWLFIFLCMLGAQVQLVSPFHHFSALSEVSRAFAFTLPANDLAPVPDLDDCSDLLQAVLPQVALASESCLPLPLTPLWRQSFAAGIPIFHLSRPPPALFQI
jgi:hypothetical protein